MKKMVYILIACLAGCASYRTTQFTSFGHFRIIRIGEIKAVDPAAAEVFAKILSAEFQAAGYQVSNDDPDIIITGVVSEGRKPLGYGITNYIDSVVITAETLSGTAVATERFEQNTASVIWTGSAAPAKIATAIARRLVKSFAKIKKSS